MNAKQKVRRWLKTMGYDVIRFAPHTHPLARRKSLLQNYGITIVLDVGANSGQYGRELRELGYKGQIISFEPMRSPYESLKVNAESDARWRTFNFALGDKECDATINIAGNSYSSSMLEMLPSHLDSAPESKYVGAEQIQVKTLDSLFSSLCSKRETVLLKSDTQGFEMNVLKGAENSLPFIDTIQLEMSLVPLYEGELLIDRLLPLLYGKGYRAVSLEPGFADRETGQLLQVDAILHRFQPRRT
jgi:FkbM family methyltransferase